MARRDAEHWTFDDLRQSRGLPSPDLSLGFLRQQFERQIEKPARQLGDLGEVWRELVPGDLVEQTRLESLSRGVLKVAARSAGAHYELDRLLRGGLQRQIIAAHRGPAFRRVQVRVDPAAFDDPAPRVPPDP